MISMVRMPSGKEWVVLLVRMTSLTFSSLSLVAARLVLSLSHNVICSKCKGKGSKSGASMTCAGCQGTGMNVSIRYRGLSMIQQMQHPCNECSGTGETINDKDRYPRCKGDKVV